jgi:hypothetical protein
MARPCGIRYAAGGLKPALVSSSLLQQEIASFCTCVSHMQDVAVCSQALELMDGEFAGLSRAMKGETLPGLEPGPDQQER